MRIQLLFILLATIPYSLQGQNLQSIEIKMVSWNIQMLPNDFGVFSKHLRKKQAKRASWIAAFCNSQDYDLIAFQEVFDRGIRRKLKKALAEEYPFQIDPINKAGRLTNNGLLIVSKKPISYLDHVTFEKGVKEDRFAAKGAVMVEYFNPLEEGLSQVRRFQIVVTHLQSGKSPDAVYHRSLQYQELHALINRNFQAEMPIFILGDLNTQKQDSLAYTEMLKTLEAEDIALNDPRPYTIDASNSWNDHEQPMQLDYILFQSRNQHIEIIDCSILRPLQEHKEEVIDLADHYGVEATLRVHFN